mgnify:CR=1 FL=1
MKKERSSLYIWKQNLFFLERERLMHAQMHAVHLPQLLLGIVHIWLILDRALSVRLPRLILTGLMHFALIFYALHFVPICTLITLPDIQIFILLHGLERNTPLKVFGPKGLRHMTDHILEAYSTDIDFRIHGFEKANENGYKVDVTEIENKENLGIIYQDEYVSVEAFPVSHGTLTCYGYKFVTADRTIVISGDTAPLELVAQKLLDATFYCMK